MRTHAYIFVVFGGVATYVALKGSLQNKLLSHLEGLVSSLSVRESLNWVGGEELSFLVEAELRKSRSTSANEKI